MKKAGLLLFFLICTSFMASIVYAEESNISASETFLTQERPVPESVQLIARILFGVQELISIQLFVVLVTFWICMFLILQNIIDKIFLFRGIKSWLLSLIIVALISITGVLQTISSLLLSTGESLKFLEKWSAGALLFAIIAIYLIGWLILKILHIVEKSVDKEKNERDGIRLGFLARMQEMYIKSRTGKN